MARRKWNLGYRSPSFLNSSRRSSFLTSRHWEFESNSFSTVCMHVHHRTSYVAASSVPILKYVTMQLLPHFKTARPASVGKALCQCYWTGTHFLLKQPLRTSQGIVIHLISYITWHHSWAYHNNTGVLRSKTLCATSTSIVWELPLQKSMEGNLRMWSGFHISWYHLIKQTWSLIRKPVLDIHYQQSVCYRRIHL